MRKYIRKRNGVRLAQDRLNSGLATLFGLLPAAALIYGWTLQEEVGGMVVPIIFAFVGGVALMGSFNGLNTYTSGMLPPAWFDPVILVIAVCWRGTWADFFVEAIPHKRSEVMSGKYVIQYMFSAGSSAAVVPLINAIGVGWTFTICMFSLTVLYLFPGSLANNLYQVFSSPSSEVCSC